jgi:hypothetical protein
MPQVTDLRFGYEVKLFTDLRQLPQLNDVINGVDGRHELHLRRRQLLGSGLKITADLLPELYKLYQDCLKMVGGNIVGDLYCQQHSEYNAYVHMVGNRFDIVISSAVLKDFRLSEIAFVIGHELGHVIFEHNRIPVGRILNNPNGIPFEFAQQLLQWSRAAEISADRLGLLCSGTLGSAACTFFKLSSGLLINNEDVIINSLRTQYAELQKLANVKRLSNEWATTHPMIPIRFHSLEMIALDILSLRKGVTTRVAWKNIDTEIMTALMETESGGDLSFISTREGVSLLMLCMLYVAIADQPLNPAEEKFVRSTQMRLAPNIHIDEAVNAAKYNGVGFANTALMEIAKMQKLSDEDAMSILSLCHYLAISDGVLEQREARAMQNICQALQKSHTLVERVISEADGLDGLE